MNRELLNSIPSDIIDLSRFAGGVRLEFVTSQKLAEINYRLVLGADYEVQNDERKEYENLGLGENADVNPEDLFGNLNYGKLNLNQNESVSGLGIFAQIEIKPSDHITLFLSARYDNYSFWIENYLASDSVNKSDKIKMDNLSPTLGVAFSYIDNQWIYANYSTAFQTPTTNELSNNPVNIGGFNKNLNPELQKGFEIGLRGEVILSRLYYNLTLFSYDISNMLIPFQNSDEVTFYRNAGEAKNRGAEILLKWRPSAVLNLSASYSVINFKYTDLMIQNDDQMVNIAGNYVPGIPKNNLNFSISSAIAYGISANINFSWTDQYFANDFNGPKPNVVEEEENYVNDEYFLTNIGLLYRVNVDWSKLSLKLGIENVFNVRYNDSIVPNAFGNNFFEPASGRAWYFSSTLEF